MNSTISHRPIHEGGTRITLEVDSTISDPGSIARLTGRLVQVAGRVVSDYERGEEIARSLELEAVKP